MPNSTNRSSKCVKNPSERFYLAKTKYKKISVFRLTRSYLNLLVKPRIFVRFYGNNIILCIFKGKMPFRVHKIIFFPEKNI